VKCAERPNGVEMAEEEDTTGFGFGTEASFEQVAEMALAMKLDAATESLSTSYGECNAGIDGGLVVGRGFDAHQLLDEAEKRGLTAASAGEEGAERHRGFGEHGFAFQW
jgi:hypothetical protein